MMWRLDGGPHNSFGRISSMWRQGRSPVLSLYARRLSTMSIGGCCVGGTASQRS